MWLKIKSINIYWVKIMKEEPKNLFSWKDEWKPIIIFYYNNWFWKTTLFTFIKETFLWNKIKDTFIDIFEMEVLLNKKIYLIKNSPSNWIKVLLNTKESSYEDFQKDLENNILNKNEKLAVAWKNQTWEQNRNTLDSLLRFNFFSDDEFKKYNQKECSLINSDLDGDTKGFLFNYILWEKIDRTKESLFKIAYRYWAKQKILNSTKNLEKEYSSYFNNIVQTTLWGTPEEDFNKLLDEKFILKETLLQIESIQNKLIQLLEENKDFLHWNVDISTLINTELKNIWDSRENYESKYKIILKQITDLKDEYGDLLKWIPTKTQKEISLRQDAIHYIKKHQKEIENYYKNTVSLLNEYKNLFLKELTNWIFDFQNITFLNRELRLSLKWWAEEKKWDWRLKTLRFLALVWVILFKSKNSYARNLWIWFFDSPFYWVDMYNSIESIESISDFITQNSLSTQLFIFATKNEKAWIEDSFENELKVNKNIYFHEYDYKSKKYLIS